MEETFALGLVNPVNATIGRAITQFTIRIRAKALTSR